MFASPIESCRPRRVVGSTHRISPHHRYWNTCTVAVALFLSVALLAGLRTKEGGTISSVLSENGHAEVALENLRFCPGTLSVPVGTTVTWINRDSVPKI